MLILFLLSIVQISYATEGQIVVGVRQAVLQIYSEEGRLLKTVGEEKPVTTKEVDGLVVWKVTPKLLVNIVLRGESVYVRTSQLKLKNAIIPPCPEELPGKDIDTATYASAAYAAKCVLVEKE
jgi:hypothetical protein